MMMVSDEVAGDDGVNICQTRATEEVERLEAVQFSAPFVVELSRFKTSFLFSHSSLSSSSPALLLY